MASRKSRRRSRRKTAKATQAASQPGHPVVFAVVTLAAVLLGIGILFTFPEQDRFALALFEVMIVGLGFVVYGAVMATGKTMEAVDELAHTDRGMVRRRRVPFKVLQGIYLIGIVVGFVRAFLQPRKTWPAVAWILSGLLLIAAGIVLLNVFELHRI